uniref:Uncharacterized protein n=1 Tax=Lygus hesperus TaxID=30085 RepID=A0A0A9WGM0_LYGHE
MRRGFCTPNDQERTTSRCDVTGLSNFSQELDASLIKNQQRNFFRLLCAQVAELKNKISSVGPKSPRRNLGVGSRTSARSVRFRSTGSRRGFCQPDEISSRQALNGCANTTCDSTPETHTDCEEDADNERRCGLLIKPRTLFGKHEDVSRGSANLTCEKLLVPQSTPNVASSTRRRNTIPRGYLPPNDGCLNPCPPLTNGGTFPDCQPRRSSRRCLIIALLFLLLLLLLGVAYFLLSCKHGSYNGCSADEGTVRYLPY